MATTALSSTFSFNSLAKSTFQLRRKPTQITCALPPQFPAVDLTAAAGVSNYFNAATAFAVLGGGAAMAAAIFLSDPEKRRQQQAVAVGGDDKDVVRDYFNSTGFQRWRRIYGEGDDVNRVQLDIRVGHAQTVDNTLKMLTDGASLRGVTVLDAGCGTGSLAIPLAKEGALVSASDISASMVAEAERKAVAVLGSGTQLPKFEVKDLESLEGRYHTVVCLDAMIHYPQERASNMIAHLASLAEKRLILSFAPKTLYYDLLKRVGELFPGPSKATRAYLHAEDDIERALRNVGWRIEKKGRIETQFYFARLIEAVPVSNS